MTFTFGSLFAGIGGIDLGLERAGMTCAWQVEVDDYAVRVLEKNWPDVRRYRDVRYIHANSHCPIRRRGFASGCSWCVAPVEAIVGGFPCQDISNAGKRVGIGGARSGLWGSFRRIVGQLRPRIVLVENVAALLVRGAGRVLGDLASLGYDAEWDCIPAAAVGAPHRRDRLFVVAYSVRDSLRLQPERHQREGRRVRETLGRNAIADDDGSNRTLADANGERWAFKRERRIFDGQWSAQRNDADGRDPNVADATCPRQSIFKGRGAHAELSRFRAACRAGWWDVEPDVGRVADGVPSRVDRLQCLGNGVVPQVAEFIGRRILEAIHGR